MIRELTFGFGKRPLAISAMNAELSPFKNGEHNSESAFTIDLVMTPSSWLTQQVSGYLGGILGVVRNYVPRTPVPPKPYAQYSRNQVPRTLKTIYHVPQARNHVPSTLDAKHFDQKFDKKWNNHNNVWDLRWSLCLFSITKHERDNHFCVKGVMSQLSVDALSELCSPFLKGVNSTFIAAIASSVCPKTWLSIIRITTARMVQIEKNGISLKTLVT